MKSKKILTVNLSEQALDDILMAFEITSETINPYFHRAEKIDEIYDKLVKAKYEKREKLNFLYKQ